MTLAVLALDLLLATGGANTQNGVSAPVWVIVLAVVLILGIGITLIARCRR
ncbi:hypothetical protein [Curtobacterium oceanosedimentum]|uniref:hypothetical protein n=1 Tax=Curtobacterium oceanosedimentum TaxID=465820 RepID=UPI001CE05BF9|nr:hypothetical protein [Curtobacterium oceanosedimentum]MCA5924770.1 hypothetical protein [Curtobacterium oceanosedimentum]